jgi:hypothetical protein
VLQFAENLTDRQAADAVRARIDWKYALVRHEAPPLRAGVKGTLPLVCRSRSVKPRAA